MPEKNTVIDILQSGTLKLTKKQRHLGSYIISNYHKVAFMNSRDLAFNAEVSESTVVRLISVLGFARYHDFQRALQSLLRERIATLETLDRYESKIGETQGRNTVSDTFSLSLTIISETLEKLDLNVFETAAELLSTKKYIILLGDGGDEIIASYASKYLRMFRDGVIDLFYGDDIRLAQCMTNCNPENSVVLAYSSPRYYRSTLDLVREFREMGINIIGVSDSTLSPLSELSDFSIITTMRYITLVDPLCSMITVTHALLNAIAQKKPDVIRKRVNEYYEYTRRTKKCIQDRITVCL